MEKLKLNNKEKDSLVQELKNMFASCKRISDINLSAKDLLTEQDFKKVKKPTLIITLEAWVKMYLLVDLSSDEISWHGLVKRDSKQQLYKLYDILMFPQKNSPTHTGTDDEKYTTWLQNLMMDKDFPFSDLRCHGHSHVNMKTFSSATDDAYQNDMIANIPDGDYYLFMILNKKREVSLFLYDFEQNFMFENNEITILLQGTNKELFHWAKSEIEDKVEKDAPAYSYYYKNKKKGAKKNGLK